MIGLLGLAYDKEMKTAEIWGPFTIFKDGLNLSLEMWEFFLSSSWSFRKNLMDFTISKISWVFPLWKAWMPKGKRIKDSGHQQDSIPNQ